jgi:hypothetical protein
LRTAALAALLACPLLLAAAGRGRGEEIVFKEHNCAVTVPEGGRWVAARAPEPDKILALVCPKTGSVFTLTVCTASGRGFRMEKDCCQVLERAFLADGSKKDHDRRFTYLKMPAYELGASGKTQGVKFKAIVRFVMTRKRTYALQCSSINGDPARDPDLKAMLQSFRFLSTPKPPLVGEPKSDLDPVKLGKLFGQAMAMLCVGIGVVVAVIVASRQKAKAKAEQEARGTVPAATAKCTHCGFEGPPIIEKRMLPVGWVILILLLVFFLPLFWLPLVLDGFREEVRVCRKCRKDLKESAQPDAER